MSEQEPVLSCNAGRESEKCRLPAAVTFLIGPGGTPLPRCTVHAQSLREALRAYLRPGTWTEQPLQPQ